MKTNKILLTVLLTAVPLFGFAQEWDEIYADPTRSEPVRVQKQLQEPQKKKVVIVQGDASNMEVVANGRNVDEYNRRGSTDTLSNDQSYSDQAEDYTEYQYTDRIVRFHDPESSIKISGADEVIVYVGDDLYENYNNRGWNSNIYYGMGWGSSYYPWYDPWYYGGYYSPWYYSRWYDPWFYGYGGWYGMRSHGTTGAGIHPVLWRDYGGWYDPWYYGYGGYGYGGGGYSYGFYDGYYSSLTHNRREEVLVCTDRVQPAEAAVPHGSREDHPPRRVHAAPCPAEQPIRAAQFPQNSYGAVHEAVYKAEVHRPPQEQESLIIPAEPMTPAQDVSLIVQVPPPLKLDQQSHRISSTRNSSTYQRNTTSPTRSGNTYQRSSTSPSRSSSNYERSSTPNRSSNTYSTPSRSSSSGRSSTYSAPTRSSSSGSSYGGNSSSSSSSSGSSGRSSGSRR